MDVNERKNPIDCCIDVIKPEIAGQIHWNNSANVLCKYMKKFDYLESVLCKRAIIPRYVIEPLDYLDLEEYRKICFPMICFCDIPFSKVGLHMDRYGEYGIGLDKRAVLEKYSIQPIHYINNKATLARDFKTSFEVAMKEKFSGEAEILADYMLSTLLYMKPIWKYESFLQTIRKKGQNSPILLENRLFRRESLW